MREMNLELSKEQQELKQKCHDFLMYAREHDIPAVYCFSVTDKVCFVGLGSSAKDVASMVVQIVLDGASLLGRQHGWDFMQYVADSFSSIGEVEFEEYYERRKKEGKAK